MTVNTQKIVNVLSGFTGPTGTFEVVNIIPNFTGPTGLYPQWAAYTGPTGASMAKGIYKDVINIGPTGPSSVSPGKGIKTVIIPGFSSGGGGGGGSVWNPADKAANATLTLANALATATATGSDTGVRGTQSHSSGKWYLEYTNLVSGTFRDKRGFATSAQVLTSYDSTHSFGVTESGGLDVPTGGSLGSPDGHVLGCAVDIDNGLFWARIDNGQWLGVSANANPVAGTGGADFTSAAAKNSTLFPYAIMFSNSGHIAQTQIVTALAAFANPPPSGFSAWG